jgi:hypothetical protein
MNITQIVSMIYSWFPTISVFLLISIAILDSEQIKPNLSGIAKFMGLMFVVMFLRISLFNESLLSSNLSRINFDSFLTAPLEDVFFVMIPLYFSRLVNNRFLSFISWTLFSILFALGHLYQGVLVAAITGIYPYFISRKYILKTNLATVMVCHYLYDCMTLFTIKIAKLLELTNVIL